MRLLHGLAKTCATFDDPNLVSRAGLVPVMALAERAGLGGLAEEHVAIGRACGVNAHLKIPCLAAPLLPGKDTVAFTGIDSMQKRVYGHKKHGAAFGHTKIQGKSLLVRGLNTLAATISTPLAAPVIAGTRLRGGSAASSRGAASFATASVATARATGCTGTLVARADSAFYSAAFTGAVRAAGAFFSWNTQRSPRRKTRPSPPG
ncbi:MAG: hypothetical protein QOJ73_947 [Streptosporangiaceae bacterium]|nr:hypothetical protein [Streptosporangiaceae bacterium]